MRKRKTDPVTAKAGKSNLPAKRTNEAEANQRTKKSKLFSKENQENHTKLKPTEGKTLPVQGKRNGELDRNVQVMQPPKTKDRELASTMPIAEAPPAKEEKALEEEVKAAEESQDDGAKQPSLAEPRNFLVQRGRQKDSDTTSQINGNVVEQVTYNDTWYVIRHTMAPTETRQQPHYLELPLVKLANAAKHMKLPTANWSSKVTLYKVAPAVLQRHTLTIFTGDLKVHKIPERERHNYQPSCVIFRREQPPEESNKCHVPYDRVIIFKHKTFSINFDGKLVNLTGAPEAVSSLSDVQKLLDIMNSITLSHSMIEIVTPK